MFSVLCGYESRMFSCFFTLIALIQNILMSNSIYIRYYAVTLKEEPKVPLSYAEACKEYSTYKAVKGGVSNSNIKVSDFLNYPKIGKLYQFELVFNKNSPIFQIESYSDNTIYLSGTWNKWLIESVYRRGPYSSTMNIINRKGEKDLNLRQDLIKLINLTGSNSGEDENKVAYPEFFKESQLGLRFSESSLLRLKAKQLGL